MALVWTLLFAAAVGIVAAPSLAGEIGFAETFALAEDRAAVLDRLSPGTEDYYFYHCLQALHTGDAAAFEDSMARWRERYGETERLVRLRNRQALLAYDKHPDKTLEHIRQSENLRFDHAPPGETAGGEAPPHSLDPVVIASDRLLEQVLNRPDPVSAMTDAGLPLLPADRLNAEERRRLLSRLDAPGHPDRIALARALLERGESWDRIPGRQTFLQADLDALRAAVPALMESAAFVQDYLFRLAPSADVSPEADPAALRAWMERAWDFLAPLSETHAALQARFLRRLLELDRREGRYDPGRFLAYVRLPRAADYLRPELRRRVSGQPVPAFPGLSEKTPPSGDEELVRDSLFHFFETAEGLAPYDQYIREDWLRPIFAEAKLTRGAGDPEQWISMITPAHYQALKDLVILEFAPDRPLRLAADAPVVLPAEIKNVGTLVVRIHALDAFNYYRQNLSEISPEIALDGLAAAWERVHRYPDPPLRRVRRELEFPELSGPGIYVVDLIGGGLRSRALIRKGDLYAVHEIGPAGLEFRVFDETRTLRKDAELWLDGRSYPADDEGVIILPFSTAPGPRRAVLKAENRCALHAFRHESESYALSAGFHLVRETLLRGLRAKAVLRPRLDLSGTPVTLSLLEDVGLTLTLTDADGVETRETVEGLKLSENRETFHDFTVPENIVRVELELAAWVKNESRGERRKLTDRRSFECNGIDATEATSDLFLRRTAEGYFIDALGKNGEARPGRNLRVRLWQRFFREPVEQVLQTDENGRVRLGDLPGILRIAADPDDGPGRQWPIARERVRYPSVVHGRTGEPVRLPWTGVPEAAPSPVRLYEVRDDVFLADRTESVRFDSGFLVLDGLEPADYRLFLRNEGADIRVRITGGERREGYFQGTGRVLEAPRTEPLGFASVEVGPGEIVARLAGAGPFTRVHATATRFVPEYDLLGDLDHPAPGTPSEIRPTTPAAAYFSGRRVGDEYRYILDRQYAAAFPGNMLDRPELLMHPWAVRDTDPPPPEPPGYEEPMAEAGAAADRAYMRESAGSPAPSAAKATGPTGSNYDFLAETATVLLNLQPDADGRIVVDRSLLGNHAQIQLVAADPLQLTIREVVLPPAEPARRDLRLGAPLPGDRRLAQRNRGTAVPAGEEFAIPDLRTARYALYGTVKTAFRLLRTLCGDPELDAFAFLGDWPSFSDSEKERRYDDYACHELNLFLHFKDPDFFARVIAPQLRQKLEPDFLDRWMLEEDLAAWADPTAFDRLTLTEQILLLKRRPDGGERIARHLADRLELNPPDRETQDRLFAAALRTQGAAPAEPSPPPISAPAMEMQRADEAMDLEAAAAEPVPEERDRAFFRQRTAKRKAQRPLYRALPTTKEWAESRFWKIPPGRSVADRVGTNPFWRDFAAHEAGTPFLSSHFPYAFGTRTEALFALAVLDLPFVDGEHERRVEDTTLRLTAATPLIVFHRELRPADSGERSLPILVSQDFFRADDRYRYEGDLRLDKFVADEFEARAAYGGQVVVGNPTSAPLRLDLLLQIPEGAMPLRNGFYTRSLPLELSPFETRRVEYGFYFPEPGEFGGFPAHVSREETLLAAAESSGFAVAARHEAAGRDGWAYIARRGEDEAVLKALRERNLARLDLEVLAFRMKDPAFFQAALDILRERLTFRPLLWSYGVFHNDLQALREYLPATRLAGNCGPVLDSPLLALDPVRRNVYAHLEYRPLVNARAHASGKPTIANTDIFEQYNRFLEKLIHTPRLGSEDLLEAVYYLLLQDRVSDAMELFARIGAESLRTRMAYDYARVYLDFYHRKLDRARAAAEPYADYPVPRWRDRFRNALAQLDEIAGTVRGPIDPESREQTQEQLADTAPALDLRLETGELVLTHRNLETCELRFYPVDVEMLFSRNPFLPDRPGQLPPVRPQRTETVDLTDKDGNGETRVAIPEPLQTANWMVEAAGSGLSRSLTRYANDLDVTLVESYGHLKVAARATGEPIPAAYVKVYAEVSGEGVRFYKDGYTDLRGRFDYLSLSNDLIDRVNRLALLVLTDEHGAAIREARPPGR